MLNTKLARVLALVFALLILLSGFLVLWDRHNNLNYIVIVDKETGNTSKVYVEPAVTSSEQAIGLSNRNKLAPNKGMLFVYSTPTTPRFWMKDMRFPIDIIWIDEKSQIISIEKNVQPDSYPKTYSPSKPVKYVLEVNAGSSDKFGWSEGDLVIFYL